MTIHTARSIARVVRLADLDNLYEAPTVPAVSEPFFASPGTLPDRARDDSSNDVVGDPSGRPGTRPAGSIATPQPIGSTLPGALPEAEVMRHEEEQASSREERYRATPVRDVPRLARGQVLKLPLSFDGTGRDYARIWFGNLLLLLLTAGLAWPWTYRRSQRYFLHHTQVAGHRMAFRLSARALWPRLGMMLALWAGVAGATAGSWHTGLLALTVGSAIWPLMSYLGLDQRVGSLSWSGRRLWFDGPWHGVYRAAFVPLVFGVSAVWFTALGMERHDGVLLAAAGVLGLAWLLAWPVSVWHFLSYRQQHLRLGPLRLRWKAGRADVVSLLARIVAWTLLVCLASSVIAGLLAWTWLLWRGGLSRVAMLALAGAALAVSLMAIVPFVQASVIHEVWNRTGNRHLRIRSSLKASRYVRLYAGQGLRLVCTLGLYWPWAAVALRRERTRTLTLWSRVDPEVLRAYWSRRQSDAPPTLMSALPPDAASSAPQSARTGTLG